MLHLNKKNSVLTTLFTALVFSTSITMAETTKTTSTTQTAQPQPQVETTSTKKVETKTEEKKEDIGSSAYTLGVTLMTTILPTASSEASSGKSNKSKLIVNAKNDAATFIASNGEVRGAYLESAFNELRKDIPQSQANDTQLAQAILSW